MGKQPREGRIHLSQRMRMDPGPKSRCHFVVSEGLYVSFAFSKMARIVSEIISEPHGQLSGAGVGNLGSRMEFAGLEPCHRGQSSQLRCIWSFSSARRRGSLNELTCVMYFNCAPHICVGAPETVTSAVLCTLLRESPMAQNTFTVIGPWVISQLG